MGKFARRSVQPFRLRERVKAVNDEAIWNKYRDELIRYATVLVGPSQAEDVLSAVVVRILRKRSLTDLNDARSYLYKSVLNEARSVRRRRTPVVFSSVAAEPEPARDDVVSAVAALPTQQRSAVYLYYWLDLSIADVAEAMGCTGGSVKRYLSIARTKLKGVLDE